MRRIRRLLSALNALARDPRIPKPVRWILVLSLLPVPGPFDEAVGLVALGLIAVFWRPVLRDVLGRQVAEDRRCAAGGDGAHSTVSGRSASRRSDG
ncbi:MAG TPA: hypothetical protein VFJ21_06140 [Mycobacteriales bacterium]|nr:hypothetical protein [Mycobacteriales bacterium]